MLIWKFFIQRIHLFLIVFPLLFLFQCSENPVQLSDNQVIDPVRQGTFVTDTLYADFDTTYVQPKPLSTLGATRLLIGSFQNFTLRPIIRFNFNPLKFKVQSATIRFISRGITGDALQEFEVTAYPITQKWTDNTDSIWSQYAPNIDFSRPIGRMTVTTAPDDTLELALTDTSLLNFWADSVGAEQNFGFTLDFSGANFIKSFQSLDSLKVKFISAGDTVVKSQSVTLFDAFLVEGQVPQVAGRDVLATLKPQVAVLHFDVDTLLRKNPQGVIINSTNLQWGFDPFHTFVNSALQASFRLVKLNSNLREPVFQIDSSFVQFPANAVPFSQFTEDSIHIEVKDGSARANFAQRFVQDALRDSTNITGYLVEFTNDKDFLSHFAFYRRNDPNPENRPRLIVNYWIPPKPRL